MKIAVDSGPLSSGHSVRGVGVSTNNLISSLKKYNKNKNLVIEPVDFSNSDLGKYDLLHVTFFNPFLVTLPEKYIDRVVVTIHDLIPLIYPKVYTPGVRGRLNLIKNKALLKKVAKIITVSQTSKKDIVRFMQVDEKKIRVIYWAARPGFKPLSNKKVLARIKRKYNLPSSLVLYVGDVNYNKNITTLADACKKANIKLVIAGKQAVEVDNPGAETIKSIKGPQDLLRYMINKPHPEIAHFQKLLKSFETNNVARLGFVSIQDLVGIYNLASCYVQPSLYEGFGLPVLEAIACETPAIISRTQALVEITRGKLDSFNPKNSSELAEKIVKIVKANKDIMQYKKLRKEFGEIYSWKKTAEKHLDLYSS